MEVIFSSQIFPPSFEPLPFFNYFFFLILLFFGTGLLLSHLHGSTDYLVCHSQTFPQSAFDAVLKEQTLYLKLFSTSVRLYISSVLHCLRLCVFNYIFFLNFRACFSLAHQFYAINVNVLIVLNSNLVYIISCVHTAKVVKECGASILYSIYTIKL